MCYFLLTCNQQKLVFQPQVRKLFHIPLYQCWQPFHSFTHISRWVGEKQWPPQIFSHAAGGDFFFFNNPKALLQQRDLLFSLAPILRQNEVHQVVTVSCGGGFTSKPAGSVALTHALYFDEWSHISVHLSLCLQQFCPLLFTADRAFLCQMMTSTDS